MKVCTDACLFGAWVAHQISISNTEIKTVLDIGAGTGLLSLMLAQKIDAYIDAVEVDELAALQAKQNFEDSPWNERLRIYQSSIQKFVSEDKYDVIISNPPFFQNSLRSNNETKNVAKHATALSFTTLTEIVDRFLKTTGRFCILLPYQEFKNFEEIAAGKNLTIKERVNVQQTPGHSYFRTMGIFVKGSAPITTTDTLVIKNKEGQYTSEFARLLQDYYLYL